MPGQTQAHALHERMLIVAGDRTYRLIGELTHTHPETVRRYMQGQAPSVEFVTALCDAFGVNPDWLLRGRGPVKAEDALAHALRIATPAQLLATIGGSIDSLTQRLTRLEGAMDHALAPDSPSTSVETKGLRLTSPAELSTTHGLAAG